MLISLIYMNRNSFTLVYFHLNVRIGLDINYYSRGTHHWLDSPITKKELKSRILTARVKNLTGIYSTPNKWL